MNLIAVNKETGNILVKLEGNVERLLSQVQQLNQRLDSVLSLVPPQALWLRAADVVAITGASPGTVSRWIDSNKVLTNGEKDRACRVLISSVVPVAAEYQRRKKERQGETDEQVRKLVNRHLID